MMTSKEIRLSFLDYFKQKDHTIVESAPIVVKNDPTLMFTNAGMNQWKGIILGNEPIINKRVADIQKCLRVSGKHNDLEEVGKDTYHHTMFEMMGNWSFGDYFKEGAIQMAWHYLIDVLRLNPNDLYATVYEGSETDHIEKDNEAYALWRQFLPENHILFGNRHDNFWEMGEVGPCGPCSEIHIDCRSEEEKKKKSGAALVNKDDPQVIEIWNLVFMQYNRKADGTLETLPHQIIDTGMGFERLVRVVQGKQSNYDTDVFQPMIATIEQIGNRSFRTKHGTDLRYGDNTNTDIAMRVIADHIRTIAFAIVDGQLPSNDKAGYVIRRILRRASRFAYSFLEQKDPFLYLLIPQLVQDMGEFYPQLKNQQDNVAKIVKAEESLFLHTLDKGLQLLDNLFDQAKQKHSTIISGTDIFTLKDTYGFPLDLTELILREKGYTTNLDEFNESLDQQKRRGREANKQEFGDWIENNKINTDTASSTFIGYHKSRCETEIIKYRSVIQKGQTLYQVVLTQTPLYAEMGGEVGDTGILSDRTGKVYPIIDTQKENGTTVHIMETIPDAIDDNFTIMVDQERRQSIERNHSATHILHFALRKVLGNQVEQKGSFVCEKYLRFDFSHFQKVSPDELREIEKVANAFIRQGMRLEEMVDIPLEEARQMGAMALFSEKYGEKVRVIKFGPSVELCGGCHVSHTGIIGSIRIINESSVATGIRRIEAVTANYADDVYYNQVDLIESCKSLLNSPQNLSKSIQKLIDENKQLNDALSEMKMQRVRQLSEELLKQGEDIDGVFVVRLCGEHEPDLVKQMMFAFKDIKVDKPFAFIAATNYQSKPNLGLCINSILVDKGKNANKIIKEAAQFIQGGGGGQAQMATAGGKDVGGLDRAVASIIQALQ